MQNHVDNPAVAEHRDGVPVVGAGDDLAERTAHPVPKGADINRRRKFTGSHPRPVFGALGAHLLDRQVMRVPAVVLG